MVIAQNACRHANAPVDGEAFALTSEYRVRLAAEDHCTLIGLEVTGASSFDSSRSSIGELNRSFFSRRCVVSLLVGAEDDRGPCSFWRHAADAPLEFGSAAQPT